MNRLGGVYKDENVVCSTTCEIYIPSSLPGMGQGTSAVKCELHSFGRCDVYLIQSTGRSMKETGSILDIPGQQKVRMDLDLNNILNNSLHYSTKDQYWYEFSRRYGTKERWVTVHFCREDQQCDQFLNFLHVTFNTMEECKRRGISPENTYRLIALEITGKVCLGDSRASTIEEKDTYIYETAWDSVLDIQFAKEEIPLEEEHAVFTHIVSHSCVPKSITDSISADKHSERGSVKVMDNMNVIDKLLSSGKMDRYLRCQKCSQTFAKENRHPRLLPCLHSLCSQCLEKQVSTVHIVQCPECGVKYDDIGEISNYPKDNTRFDLMEYLHLKEESYMPHCTICPEMVATHRCTRCAEWLCHTCHEAHQRVTATKKHPLLSLDEVKCAKNLEVFKKSVMCRRHSQSCLNFYYTSECFMEPMCATCALEKNDKKGVHKIEEAAKTKRLEMTRLNDTVEKVRSGVTKTIKRIQSEKMNIKEHADVLDKYVDTTFEELILVLEKSKAEFKSDLQKSMSLKLKMLEEQAKELVELQKEMEEAEDLTNLVLVSPNSISVMQMEKTITRRLDKLAKKAFDASPRELATFGFYKDDLALKLTQVVADNAQIWSSAISPGKSVTIVDETYLEDDSVRFTLIPQDYRGIPIKIDTAVMKATIEDPKENIINCVLTPRQDDYSLVDITAEIKSLGRHLLRIYMGDNLVATTPFDRTRVYLRSTLPLGMAQKVISLDLDETDV